MGENPILMTRAEFARRRNKSPQYLAKLVKAGILVNGRPIHPQWHPELTSAEERKRQFKMEFRSFFN